ncbi:cell division protein ZapE [Nitrogeniibacter mangrovi]|uniref:Cell division protein ZapE n=1 Tax=Nitrogeniibacter mangrovi TaxID=2016596 RepID=A0A6C1B272_9RHOO|nr:cell division protein ZapE [Nitrogeniibacter mangrovi]QID17741.1 cell division protein ZapE [Nitrogeniibacter mangrovi]
MPHRVLKVPEHGMIDAYKATLAERGYSPDPAQEAAVKRLQRLYSDLLGFKVARQSFLKKYVFKPQQPRSVYFWGGVGRGKSFLMDCFFESIPYRRKRRVHFHAFMQEVQNDLKQLNHLPDPLKTVADRIADETRLLCFDEFHVSDIADAMILGRLLEALFERGVIFVMTSNYPPDGLYPNGLQRINFLPTIGLLKQRFDVIEVDYGTDYRLRTLEQLEKYLVPDDDAARQRMSEDFFQIAGFEGAAGELEILGRRMTALRLAPGVVWFDFAVLCGGPRSQNDYLELAREHHTLLLSGVPKMNAGMSNEARRFTWLVDVLYDHRVKLIMSAAVDAPELYTEGNFANEFVRTVSRLLEMRSREYLGEAHRPE